MASHSLQEKLPAPAWPVVNRWLHAHPCGVKLCAPRKTKIGDFRPPRPNRPALITLNHDLAPYPLLLTFTHELAHWITWSQQRRRVAAHGPEWRKTFADLLLVLASTEGLDPSFRHAVRDHSRRPRSSASYDPELYRCLRQLDGSNGPLLESLSPGQKFQFRGRSFRLERVHRTRCVVRSVEDNQPYRLSKMAEVELET